MVAQRALSITAALLFGTLWTSAASADDFFSELFGARPQQRDMVATYGEDAQPTRATPATSRQMVEDPTGARAGSVTVNTPERALYLSLGDGRALRYDIGVGREGFTWRGKTQIGRMQSWPDWTPPSTMLKRRPDLPRHMTGGLDNPLGARAMYLYAGGRDTMFRIHGSNEPDSIGRAVSSGCIRMLNDDVVDLFSRVRVGTTVNVI